MAIIAMFTGLNMLEICGLQWKHVNLTGSPVRVDGNLIPPRSIAVKKQWNRVGLDNVRETRSRDVPVSQLLLSLFTELKQKQAYAAPNNFVLVTRIGTAFWPGTILQNRLKPLGRELGMPWLSWHMFTKAHKTIMSELGMRLTGDLLISPH